MGTAKRRRKVSQGSEDTVADRDGPAIATDAYGWSSAKALVPILVLIALASVGNRWGRR